MLTGAFSQNVGKLFSEFKLVTDNLLFIYAEVTENVGNGLQWDLRHTRITEQIISKDKTTPSPPNHYNQISSTVSTTHCFSVLHHHKV